MDHQTQYTYEPFGDTTSTGTSSGNANEYTGREFDETGIYFYRARYYNPTIARFISEDPLGFNAGTNFYSYAGNNPTNLVDSLGLQAARPLPVPAPGPVLAPDPTPVPSPYPVLDGLLGVVGVVLSLEGHTGSEAYDSIQLGWWPPLARSPNFDPYKEPGRCKNQKGCKPCVPPVGTISYQPNSPTGGSHYPFGTNHWHLWEMHQSPPSAGCQCFWVELGVGTGNPPHVAQPYPGPAQGGVRSERASSWVRCFGET